MNNIQFHPSVIGWFITIVLFVTGYVFAFIRQNGKNEAHHEELRREIERLTRTDIDLMEKTLEIKSKRKNIPKKSVESLIQLQKMENKINQMIEDRQSFNYLLVTSLALGYGGEILSN